MKRREFIQTVGGFFAAFGIRSIVGEDDAEFCVEKVHHSMHYMINQCHSTATYESVVFVMNDFDSSVIRENIGRINSRPVVLSLKNGKKIVKRSGELCFLGATASRNEHGQWNVTYKITDVPSDGAIFYEKSNINRVWT